MLATFRNWKRQGNGLSLRASRKKAALLPILALTFRAIVIN
jgi:hypothetical protein